MSSGSRSPSARAPWLHGPRFDAAFILLPPLLSVAVVLALGSASEESSLPLWSWVVLVVGVDVAHVYSTLFRTYLDREAFARRRALFVTVPLVAWMAAALLHRADPALFWRALAYLAVFHFVRQQYGFVRLYSRHDEASVWSRRLDALVIYAATLYPLVYWHAHLPRSFEWFLPGDFIAGLPIEVERASLVIYVALLVLYVAQEVKRFSATRRFNVPKNLLIVGTCASWYVGIVLFDGDLAFTLTNVVSHGIPYLALVWAVSHRKLGGTVARARGAAGSKRIVLGAAAFLGLVLGLAYLEEGLWAGWIWREHLDVFGPFAALPRLDDSVVLSAIVPLLALPQLTHYILDGFIWRTRGALAPKDGFVRELEARAA